MKDPVGPGCYEPRPEALSRRLTADPLPVVHYAEPAEGSFGAETDDSPRDAQQQPPKTWAQVVQQPK